MRNKVRSIRQSMADRLALLEGGALLGLLLWLGGSRLAKRMAGIKVSDAELKKFDLPLELAKHLPLYPVYAHGGEMEPVNLLLCGTEREIRRRFKRAGWYEADSVNWWNFSRAWLAVLLNIQYLHGPITPLFIDGKMQAMSWQKPTPINKFKQRHHLRIWRSNDVIENGRQVWLVQASYDPDIKKLRFPPAHVIDPDLDYERDIVVEDLTAAGAKLRGYLSLPKVKGQTYFGEPFHSDGRIAVVEL